MQLEVIEGDVIHETRGAAMTCYQFVKTATVLNRKKATRSRHSLGKSVIECCNRGNDCETRERATKTRYSS